MVEPVEICAWAERLLRRAPPCDGRHFVVTAGPTREALDPVRIITNRSSGRMGYALAQEAWFRGAEVTLISGPSPVPPPPGPRLVQVETTEQLRDAVSQVLPSADVLVMAAAPADFQPAQVSAHKVKRGAGVLKLALEPTLDVLGSTAYWRRTGTVVVGFALETHDLLEHAREKLVAKQLDLIVANLVGPDSGPEVTTNRVTILGRDSVEELPLQSKDEVALAICDRIGALLERRTAAG
jgi:phosphopantothenoylcysteine decarboxylase/phosphopantothenate--cysteine ligase